LLLDLQYFRGASCRDRVIDAARTAISQGEGNFTADRVADIAGLPRAVVYLHFPSMEGLRDLILENFFLEVMPAIVGANFERMVLARQHLTELDLVRLFLDVLRTVIEEYPNYFRADFASSNDRRQLQGWSFFQAFLDRYLGLVDFNFDRGREAGVFSENLSPGAIRQFLRGLFLGSTMQCLFLPSGYDPSFLFEKVKEQTQRLLCAGRYDWKMMTD